jgi:hypothetical protein
MAFARQKPYKDSFDRACRVLLESEPPERFREAGVTFTTRNDDWIVEIPFFNETITMTAPGFSFRSSQSANVTLVTRIIILHYLTTASGRPLDGEKIAYEDIPGLRHYLPVFTKRVARSLSMAFGGDPHAFLEAGWALGGRDEPYGDAAFTLDALPRVPITFILWGQDDEFPPSLKTLYDSTVTSYLPLEDILVLTKLAGTRILKAARRLFGDDDLL